MTPQLFLTEEFASVRRALDETLRYDYGADPDREYYHECVRRLARIENDVRRAKQSDIWALRNQLVYLANWISLIERSRLGEFSWPFAEELRSIAKPLLVETDLLGQPVEPIVHVIAEGDGYQIVYEGKASVPSPSAGQNFAIIAFPRPFRYHVLLHTIFGHELGHAAQGTNTVGALLSSNVADVLSCAGYLSSTNELNSWVNHPDAPNDIKTLLLSGRNVFSFDDFFRRKWIEELVCDLFGLLLFGPGFLAAHYVLLRSAHRTPYEFDLDFPTHPPYAVRHNMLVKAVRLLGWDQPTSLQGEIHSAEKFTLNSILTGSYSAWSHFFDDQQLQLAIEGIQDGLARHGDFGYTQPTDTILTTLVNRLVQRLPPITANISSAGEPELQATPIAHVLYAGWVYWFGQDILVSSNSLSFLDINRLCDQALLQERAISITLEAAEK